jgi:hypothetical protein
MLPIRSWARDWRILPKDRCLAQDDNIVNTLATDRPNQSFGEAGPVSNDKFPRTHKAP